jgi:hypothetical protein
MQSKKILEERDADPAQAADEDGPASSEGADAVRDITDDEGDSSSEDGPEKLAHGTIYGGYFERSPGAAGGELVVRVASKRAQERRL